MGIKTKITKPYLYQLVFKLLSFFGLGGGRVCSLILPIPVDYRVDVSQEGSPLPGPKSGMLSNTLK